MTHPAINEPNVLAWAKLVRCHRRLHRQMDRVSLFILSDNRPQCFQSVLTYTSPVGLSSQLEFAIEPDRRHFSS
jgi:hypothetical protein